MASRPFRSDAAPDPTRQHLKEVRRGLLRLHKTLIDSERAAFERDRGAVSSSQLLQALLEDPFFAWLRPFSSLIIEIDEALAAKEPLDPRSAAEFIDRVRRLVETDEGDERMGEPGRPYDRVVRRDPDVLLAHVELSNRLGAG